MSKFINIIGNLYTISPVNGVSVRFPHFNHDFAMTFFYSKVRKDFWKDGIEAFAANIALVNRFPVWVFKLLFAFGLDPVFISKKRTNVFDLFFIHTCKFKNTAVMWFFFRIPMFNIIHIKTPIAINISRKVDPILFFHKISVYVKSYFTLYANYLEENKARPERLNEWTPKGDAKVWTRSKEREIDPKRLVRQFVNYIYTNWSTKVTESRVYATYIVLTRQVTITNEDPILNSAAARLGQAMRETQDVLVRDSLESTASVLNCVGGTNGRQIAVLKSDLIEVELLAA